MSDTAYETTKISELGAISTPAADSLFIVSQKSGSQYKSNKLTYKKLSESISSSLGVQDMKDILADIDIDIESQSRTLVLDTPPAPNVISAIHISSNGIIDGISGYALSAGMDQVFRNVTLTKLSATESPWIQTSSIASEVGTSTSLVASQKLAYDISSSISSSYLPISDVVSVIGDSIYKAASQSLAKSLSTTADGRFLLTSNVVSISGNATDKAASQKFASDISTAIADLREQSLTGNPDQVVYLSSDGSFRKQSIMNP